MTKDIKLCTIELERKFEKRFEMEMKKMYNSLVSEFTENEPYGLLPPEWIEWMHISQGKTHCVDCLVLDGCWFEKSQMPKLPQHPRCHCIALTLPFSMVEEQAEAESAYSKFDPYLFDVKGEYGHGKNKMFESWGYTVEDSTFLQTEMEKQARQKYIWGDYVLGKLNDKGQRINIRVKLDRKDGQGEVSFITGWMVQPDGHIKMNTPYGGK